ncbi:MAG: chromosomal replication initiator protein DnaA [Nitrospinaceae bacterium]|nr:chromosomal replication initiator protein DnaA [Nitrospinaceae bacterium]NIR57911.1 chromosomal replication initiator protein DnaA [Nitrospinaceae bacterium]NIS88369.1 chromosomal replication initiator protein DnaA [Nitrospinaceae bacterium]NIT85247.1 chromosomal replication initiator protein DnaA [Nitrospinaceae bacterium]NIU47400.1 chromosomal replication initiator protein DnaA [Nitrospinaceae bacterium]
MQVLWKNCLDEIEKQVLPENFNTWFTPTYPCEKTDREITIAVPNRFFEKCLTENYLDLIHQALETVSQKQLRVRFIIQNNHENPKPAVDEKEEPAAPPSRPTAAPSFLNPRYTFDSFVVGPNNQFAHAACQAVAGHPAHNYNPLFLYGAVGLGKTHLLHAIGNAILKSDPEARIRYISAESFTVDLIESIKKDCMQAFRERYRPLDVLLVDDIQFIAGKERTQEEFFYTFNSLYEYHKQIVISSDRYPKDMQNIEERLRSRFESGLIADIMPPDLETKMAILYKKAELHQKSIPQDVAMFLANNIKSNIRELEGLLLRIIAFSSFTRREIDLELAQEVLKDFTIDKNRNFTIPNIQKTVAQLYNLKIADLKSKKRSRDISVPRQIAMYICREHTQASLPEIGRQFGGKDHTTVIFSHRKISKLVKENKGLQKDIQDIIKAIENG